MLPLLLLTMATPATGAWTGDDGGCVGLGGAGRPTTPLPDGLSGGEGVVRMASDSKEGDDVITAVGAAGTSRLGMGGGDDGASDGEFSAEKIACGPARSTGAGRGRRRVEPLAGGGEVLS